MPNTEIKKTNETEPISKIIGIGSLIMIFFFGFFVEEYFFALLCMIIFVYNAILVFGSKPKNTAT